MFFPTTFMLRVSFSPVPEHVVADCWNRGFPTPPCHQATVIVLYLVKKDFLFGNFLEADYHYTTIFGQSHSLRRFYYLCRKAIYGIGTKKKNLQ